MAYEQKDNSGSMFKNERKEKDTHPDRTGSAMIDGTSYWVNGWVKQDKNGNPWLSLAFKRKEAKPQPTQGAAPKRHVGGISDTIDDEIPF